MTRSDSRHSPHDARRPPNLPVQYSALQKLAADYADRGLTVIGVPCNQFMGQEPGSADEIKEFCSTRYGVTFPLLEKAEVTGEGRHPLYAELTKTPIATAWPATCSGTSRSSCSPLVAGSSTGSGPAQRRMPRRWSPRSRRSCLTRWVSS